MKSFLFCLLSLSSLTGYAQESKLMDINTADPKSVVFDFTAPSTLTPAVTPSDEGGTVVGVSGIPFRNDSVTLSMNKVSNAGGATIFTFHSELNQDFEYWLEVNSNTQLDFKCNGGILESIEFPKSDLSGIAVEEGQSGTISQYYRTWYSDPDNLCESLLLCNNSIHYARIHTVKVNYYLYKAQYTPICSIEQSEALNQFSDLKLTFDENVSFKDSVDFRITYRGGVLNKTVVTNGNVATISLDESVYDDGELVIHIPSGCFVGPKGYFNKELEYTYNIVRKRDTFCPISVVPDTTETVPYLASEGICLQFDGVVSDFKPSLRFHMFKEGEREPVCLLRPIKAEDNTTVKLMFMEAATDTITKTGHYSIVIPAMNIYHFKGDEYESWNPEIVLNYEINRGDIALVSVEPADSSVVEEFESMKLVFDHNVSYTETEDLTVSFEGRPKARTVAVEDSLVTISVTDLIENDGKIRVHVPAYCFATEDGLTNKDMDFVYDIKSIILPRKNEARKLLARIGVGYPRKESTAYRELDSLVNVRTTLDSINMAIENMYKETDILLPTNDEYYKIVSVNSNGDLLYVGYSYTNEHVFITKDINKAAAFASEMEDGNIIFKTVDDRYLHVLTANVGYGGTTPSGVTESKSDVNSLVFARLHTDEASDSATYGMMSMYGLLGVNKLTDAKQYTYAVVDFQTNSLVAEVADMPFFSDKFSSAFMLVKASKPNSHVEIQIPSVAYNKQKDGISVLSLTFDESDEIAVYRKPAIVTVVNTETGVATDTELVKEYNNFKVTLKSLAPGCYSLVVPENTLMSKPKTDSLIVKGFSVDFKVFNPYDAYFYALTDLSTLGPHPCEKLNNFGYYVEVDMKSERVAYKDIYNDTTMTFVCMETYLREIDKVRFRATTDSLLNEMEKTDGHLEKIDSIIVDEMLFRIVPCYAPKDMVPTDKVVKLMDISSRTVLKTGKFVRFDTGDPNIRAIKIEFDGGEIMPGELRDGPYVFEMDEGTFGDTAFGRYLENPYSVAMNRCIVNPYFIQTVEVGTTPDAINDVNSSSPARQGIYDLMGNKLEKICRPGVYIVNGKKVMKR